MAQWRIYYGDSSIVEGETRAEFLAAPGTNVQAIAAVDPRPLTDTGHVGRLVIYGCDYYLWPVDYSRPIGLTLFGWWSEADSLTGVLANQLAAAGVKHGLTMADDAAFFAILDKARTDPGLPVKSAWTPGERAVRKLTAT